MQLSKFFLLLWVPWGTLLPFELSLFMSLKFHWFCYKIKWCGHARWSLSLYLHKLLSDSFAICVCTSCSWLLSLPAIVAVQWKQKLHSDAICRKTIYLQVYFTTALGQCLQRTSILKLGMMLLNKNRNPPHREAAAIWIRIIYQSEHIDL